MVTLPRQLVSVFDTSRGIARGRCGRANQSSQEQGQVKPLAARRMGKQTILYYLFCFYNILCNFILNLEKNCLVLICTFFLFYC